MTSNGVDIPMELIPEPITDEIGELDGSEIALTISLIYYLR